MKIMKNDEAVSPGKAVLTEEAVSPVIGVILMVAITVILAATIAYFVFGLAGAPQSTRTVGLTVSLNQTDDEAIKIQFTSGTDLSSLSYFVINYDGAEVTPASASTSDATSKVQLDGNKIEPTDAAEKFAVGEIVDVKLAAGDTVSGHKITVIGTFTDGGTQILYDRTL